MLTVMTLPPKAADGKSFRVLVVDDEESIVWALRRAVEAKGLQVISASTAERAIEAARVSPPDVILVDVKLPGMSGLAALEEFKRVVPLAKVVVMTAHGSLETAVKALRQGALEYLPKPFDLAQVKELIETALQNAPADALVQSLRKAAPSSAGIVGRCAASSTLPRATSSRPPSCWASRKLP